MNECIHKRSCSVCKLVFPPPQNPMDPVRTARKSSLTATFSPSISGSGTSGVATTSGGSGGRHATLPPLTFNSDSERDAQIRNRKEQIRLNKLLDHIDIQERVYVQLFNKERHVVEISLTPSPARSRHHHHHHRHQLHQQQQQQVSSLFVW